MLLNEITEEYAPHDDMHRPYIYSKSDHFTLVLPDPVNMMIKYYHTVTSHLERLRKSQNISGYQIQHISENRFL